ncbi:MAG: hypothetical protein GY870_06910 [archaeon]|nr:hypothetical protein [archaeon]
MNNGWIKIHRKFKDWEWYDDLKTKHLFLHLLLSANHKKGKWRGIKVEKGQLVTGLYSLKEQTGLSIQNVRTSLDKLKRTKELTIKSTNKYSIITLINWDKYQKEEKNQQANQQTTNKQLTTNKNEKNEKNIISYKNLKKPYNDFMRVKCQDGTIALRYFGIWVDPNTHSKIDLSYYRELK